MENFKDYIKEFKKINEEEERLRNQSTETEEYKKEEEEFYKRKNELSLQFIKDVNSGKIPSDEIAIWYLDSGDYFYYDKIYIDFIDKYDSDLEVNYENCFTILPPVITDMKEGCKELYEFMDKHIKETFEEYQDYDEEIGYFFKKSYNLGGPFPWSGEKEITSAKHLNHYKSYVDEVLDRFSETGLITDKKESEIKEEIENIRKDIEEIILKDMNTYGLTQEESNLLQNTIFAKSNIFTENNELNFKNIFAELIKRYDKDVFEKLADIICDIEKNDLDLNKDNMTEYIYENTSEKNRDYIVENIELTEDIVNNIIENGSEDEISVLSKNGLLTNSQVLALRDKVSTMSSEIQSEILKNMFSRDYFDENVIRDMFNGSDEEHEAVIKYCRSIPEDIIKDMLDGPMTYEARPWSKNISNLSSVLKNNQNLSVELIDKFKELTDRNDLFVDKGWFQSCLISQKNISLDMMLEIAKHANGTTILSSFLSREDKPDEVIETFANAEWVALRGDIAEALSKGEITVSEETFRKLALDREIKEDIRIKLLDMPEFKEKIPEIGDSELDLEIKFYDRHLGGDDESFDGTREFFVDKIKILDEDSRKNSTILDEKEWKKSAHTSFDHCTGLEEFESYCNEHKRAIKVIMINNELYETFETLKDRVESIENNKEFQEKSSQPVHNISEVEEALSDRTVEQFNETTNVITEGVTNENTLENQTDDLGDESL